MSNVAPTLVASRTALPPEGVHFALGRPGGETLAPMLVALRTALPPEGAACRGSKPAIAGLDGMQRGCVSQPGGLQGLRLRPGRAGSAALADDEGIPTLFTAFALLPHEEAGLKRVSPALCAHG